GARRAAAQLFGAHRTAAVAFDRRQAGGQRRGPGGRLVARDDAAADRFGGRPGDASRARSRGGDARAGRRDADPADHLGARERTAIDLHAAARNRPRADEGRTRHGGDRGRIVAIRVVGPDRPAVRVVVVHVGDVDLVDHRGVVHVDATEIVARAV